MFYNIKTFSSTYVVFQRFTEINLFALVKTDMLQIDAVSNK